GRTEKHNRWNRDLPPRAQTANGDVIVFHTTSADDDQIDPERPTFVGYDRTRVHPLTGPVYVREAEPGDVLDVEVLDVETGEWGWQMLTGTSPISATSSRRRRSSSRASTARAAWPAIRRARKFRWRRCRG